MKTYYLTITCLTILCLITCLTILGLMLYAMMAKRFEWELALIAGVTLLLAEQCRFQLIHSFRAFRKWKKLTTANH